MELESFLIIKAPKELEARYCYVKMRSDLDIDLKYLSSESKWLVRILPNELAPEVGPLAYIEISKDEPE